MHHTRVASEWSSIRNWMDSCSSLSAHFNWFSYSCSLVNLSPWTGWTNPSIWTTRSYEAPGFFVSRSRRLIRGPLFMRNSWIGVLTNRVSFDMAVSVWKFVHNDQRDRPWLSRDYHMQARLLNYRRFPTSLYRLNSGPNICLEPSDVLHKFPLKPNTSISALHGEHHQHLRDSTEVTFNSGSSGLGLQLYPNTYFMQEILRNHWDWFRDGEEEVSEPHLFRIPQGHHYLSMTECC